MFSIFIHVIKTVRDTNGEPGSPMEIQGSSHLVDVISTVELLFSQSNRECAKSVNPCAHEIFF